MTLFGVSRVFDFLFRVQRILFPVIVRKKSKANNSSTCGWPIQTTLYRAAPPIVVNEETHLHLHLDLQKKGLGERSVVLHHLNKEHRQTTPY